MAPAGQHARALAPACAACPVPETFLATHGFLSLLALALQLLASIPPPLAVPLAVPLHRERHDRARMRAAGSHGSTTVKEDRQEAAGEQQEEALVVEIGHMGTEAGREELSLAQQPRAEASGSSLAQQHQQQVSEQMSGAGVASDVSNTVDAAAAASSSNPQRPKSLSLGSYNSWSKVREKVVRGELKSELAKRPVSRPARLARATAV